MGVYVDSVYLGRQVGQKMDSQAIYANIGYQVSTTEGAGFNTVNIIVDQTTAGVEWESS